MTEQVPTPPAAVIAETRVTVGRTVKLDGTDEDSSTSEDVISVQKFITTPAMVTVSIPVKLSRQFQSVGLEVGVHLPCYKEEVPAAIELAYRIAKERVSKEIPVMKTALEGVTGHAP